MDLSECRYRFSRLRAREPNNRQRCEDRQHEEIRNPDTTFSGLSQASAKRRRMEKEESLQDMRHVRHGLGEKS